MKAPVYLIMYRNIYTTENKSRLKAPSKKDELTGCMRYWGSRLRSSNKLNSQALKNFAAHGGILLTPIGTSDYSEW
jgi:hypothetical protein